MNPERWQKINDLFHAALEVDENERGSFLKKECGDEVKLFEEVTRFLFAYQQADDFIQTPMLPNALQVLNEQQQETSDLVGKRFGVYQIVEEIGRGGMGAVYLAARTDREFEKRVAIKIIKRGMDTEAVLRRFRNERQILASLEHPNIARLLDGGTTQDGLPYFVMEYIEGLPITEFAEVYQLSINERLELFRQVCTAITFAHQRLIIHRDIKPLNILVIDDGTPKLLDFGIAKLTNPDRSDQETAPTDTGLRLMTPEYASPEQIQGLQVTTLSDVYSLGVILYELLSGQAPYKFEQRSLFEIANIIRTEEPLKPSERAIETRKNKKIDTLQEKKTTPSALPNPQALRGDLDNIVLMAMRKEPDKRYISAGQFSEDIRRHLAGLPVIARPLNLKHRFAKFALRNKAAVTLGAIIFITLIGGIVATSWQSVRANRQAKLAEKRFNEVRKLAHTVLFDYHDAIKDLPGSTPVRERLVRDGLTYLDGLASEESNDATLQLEIATAYERIGDVQGGRLQANLGNTGGAIESYRKASAILQTPPLSDLDTTASKSLNASIGKKLGELLWEKGDLKDALEESNKSQTLYQKLSEENPSEFDYRYEYSSAFDRNGQILQDQGDLENAKISYQKDLEISNTFSPAERETEKFRRGLSVYYEHVGELYLQLGEYKKALENNSFALEIRQKLADDFPLNADYQRTVSVSYYNQGEILAKLLRYYEALQSYQKDLEIAETLSAKDPSNDEYRDDTAYALIRVGDILVQLSDNNQAMSNYRKSQKMREEDVKADSSNLMKRSSLIESYAKISKTLSKMGQIESAKSEALATFSLLGKTEVESDNAAIRGFFAETFIDLGETYTNLSNLKIISVDEKVKLNISACEMDQKAAEIMQDMTERNMMTKSDMERFDKLKPILDKCQ